MDSENQYLAVIRMFAAAAWADGEVVKKERAVLERFIGSADLTDAERTTARGYLDRKVSLDSMDASSLSVAAKEGAYRAACKLAMVDQHVADAERSFLKRLRDVLGLDAKLAAAIEKHVGV